jgi:predicted XRE-type DNA-binding protein
MSTPQTNFENNNRMSELTKNINYIFGYILLYSLIIFTTLSAVFGGVVVYPIYAVICIIKKIREQVEAVINCCKSAEQAEVNLTEVNLTEVNLTEVNLTEVNLTAEKKPIIDENWCNISVKNIINYTSEVQNEIVENENLEADVNLNEVQNEIVQNEIVQNEVEEILSIRRPSEEELRQFQEEEADAEDESSEEDDYSPKDKYSIGHYKSKTHINDPLDFDN